MYKKIFVPLDGSEFAEKVLSHVETIARCTGAAVVLLRIPANPRDEVWGAAATVGYMSIPLPPAEVREDVVKEAANYLSRVTAFSLKDLDKNGIARVDGEHEKWSRSDQ